MVAVAATLTVPVSIPFNYGFPLDAQNGDSNLSLSFRSLVGVGDDPGPYSLPVSGKYNALTVLVY